MSYTPFNAPILAGLLGDAEIAAFFSVLADLDAMLKFEAALAAVQGKMGVIPREAAERIGRACADFEPNLVRLGEATSRDGVALPDLVEQLRARIGEPHARHVHHGATSQDTVDTSAMMRLASVMRVLQQRVVRLLAQYDKLSKHVGKRKLVAHTRMQPALAIRASDRIALWRRPVAAWAEQWEAQGQSLLCVQFGGPVGTLSQFGAKGPGMRARLADALELGDPHGSWHADRSRIANLGHFLSRLTGTLGKYGQDVALMAQEGPSQVVLAQGGSSSSMPGKSNPVRAEALVALARFNATLNSGLHQSLVHEQERSGAAWTLEWMLLPQMAVAAGASLRNAELLTEAVVTIGEE